MFRQSASPFASLAALVLTLVPAAALADDDVDNTVTSAEAENTALAEADATTSAEASAAAANARFPLTGEVSFSGTAAGGSFVFGEQQRESLDGSLGLSVAYKIAPALSFSTSLSVSKNLITNVDSGAVRPYDTQFSDLDLRLAWTPQERGPKGKMQGYKLPGGFGVGFDLGAALPTSRASQFQTKLFSLSPGVSLSKTKLLGGMLTLSYKFVFSKNFHRYTNAVVSDAELAAVSARPGGAELLGDGAELATSAQNTSFSFRNRLLAAFEFGSHWNAAVSYTLSNGFRYTSVAVDEFSSPHAIGGRGRSDSQMGIVNLGYNIDKAGVHSLSASATTISAPFAADNKTFRFPFFDTRSLSDNYTSVSLSYARTF